MLQFYSMDDIKLHNGKNGEPVWILIKKSIYNVTPFLDEHPGGKELIEEYAGKDATKAFNQAGHSIDAETMLKKYKIGELATVEDNLKNIHTKRRHKFFFCI